MYFKFHENRSRGLEAVKGRKSPSPIDLAHGLYNSLYYGTSRHKSLACDVSLVTNNELLMNVQLGNVFVVNVYLPDASISGRNEIMSDICNQIVDNADVQKLCY